MHRRNYCFGPYVHPEPYEAMQGSVPSVKSVVKIQE